MRSNQNLCIYMYTSTLALNVIEFKQFRTSLWPRLPFDIVYVHLGVTFTLIFSVYLNHFLEKENK